MLDVYTNPIFYQHDTGARDIRSRRGRIDAALAGVEARWTGIARKPRYGRPSRHRSHDRERFIRADYETRVGTGFAPPGLRDFVSGDNPMSSQTFAAARTAVGAALTAAEEMLRSGRTNRAFVVARAGRDIMAEAPCQPMGFLFLQHESPALPSGCASSPVSSACSSSTSTSITANGTQALFWGPRTDVFYASMHRFPFYPGTGATNEIGEGKGRGYTLNIPFEEGLGDAAYLRGVEEVDRARAIDDYAPQAILLSSGFDAHRRDPLGGMRVTEQAYGEITRRVVRSGVATTAADASSRCSKAVTIWKGSPPASLSMRTQLAVNSPAEVFR